uniref:Lambda class glutathione S-transferases n=1 Tax=Pinus yunnanensis TaxID=88732 RepID=A0A9E8M4I2_PINYU|nr:lambda class glutathione S-transferases [Pinus yunnanensis]
MAALYLIPPALTSKSEPPPLFDGTTRSSIDMRYPYPMTKTIENTMRGLSQIQIVPIDLQDRPAWYKEKVYPPNKVPSLEHNGKVTGESMDLLQYLDNNFEGPKLFPTDPAEKEAANALLKHTDTFTKNVFVALTKPDSEAAQEAGPALDYLENALGKFSDGPFLLGQLSVADIAYGPFVERFQVAFPALKNYDITAGRPKLLKWIQELHKIEGYAKTTVADPEIILETYKRILAIFAKRL